MTSESVTPTLKLQTARAAEIRSTIEKMIAERTGLPTKSLKVKVAATLAFNALGIKKRVIK